jgi:4-hydroxy-tetrahydrodipicolinate reductase
MKIALVGYGKMGKAIASLAKERGHDVVATIDDASFDLSELNQADVAIEFTQPDAAVHNIYKCFEANVPIVVGTTGWYDKYEEVSNFAKSNGKSLFTATNFSIGVNLFFSINKKLAAMMNQFPEYEVSMNETHHIHKLDHPSGTAVTLAEGILNNIDRKKSYVGLLENEPSQLKALELKITSKREDEVPGFHEVVYESEIDEIKISHNAKTRKGFALGSIIAAEWLQGKKGVFGMSDLLKF